MTSPRLFLIPAAIVLLAVAGCVRESPEQWYAARFEALRIGAAAAGREAALLNASRLGLSPAETARISKERFELAELIDPEDPGAGCRVYWRLSGGDRERFFEAVVKPDGARYRPVSARVTGEMPPLRSRVIHLVGGREDGE